MRANTEWKLALPEPSAEDVVKTFQAGFRELATGAGSRPFEYAMRETDITEELALHLQSIAPRMTIVGFWLYEVHSNNASRTNPRRTDIAYYTVHDNKHAVTMVFECKKLDGPSAKNHSGHLGAYKKSGMLRFVRGDYAPKERIGFMVGFSARAADKAMAAVRRSLGGGSWKAVLGMGTYPDGKQWRQPPTYFAAHTTFETMHTRSKCPEITLYHMDLPFD